MLGSGRGMEESSGSGVLADGYCQDILAAPVLESAAWRFGQRAVGWMQSDSRWVWGGVVWWMDLCSAPRRLPAMRVVWVHGARSLGCILGRCSSRIFSL